MPEFSTLSDIFGRGAWPKITGDHHRRWGVATVGCWRTFGSQWELLAWIGGRL